MALVDQGKITALLNQIRAGKDEAKAKDEFCRLVYDQLRAVAHSLPKCDTQPTSIVNELMIKLIDHDTLCSLENRRAFFSVATEAMRQILIDHYRTRTRQKRGGYWKRVPLDSVLEDVEQAAQADFEQLHIALNELKRTCPKEFEVVDLRFFGGLTIAETATLMDVSTRTVDRYWNQGKSKLLSFLERE